MFWVSLSYVGVVVFKGKPSVAIGAEDSHFNLPQHFELVSHRLACAACKEIIKAFLLELFGRLTFGKGSAEPDVVFQVVFG